MDTAEKVGALLETERYRFLRENEHLQNTIIFLTLGGSHAYGTNIESSDIDVRGVCNNRPQDIIGLSHFEQFVHEETDTAVYSFNKLISLLINCNPNVIEMLGCKPEHYFMMTDTGKELIANRKMFLSLRAVNSFGGYASAQLHRLRNNLARYSYSQPEKEEHILGSITRAMLDFNGRYQEFEEGGIRLSIDKSEKEGLETEIFADVNLTHYPLRDYKSIWSDMQNVVKDYARVNHRNHKKDDQHINKHAMHLIRLYLMCLDILEKEEIVTFREADLGLLMSIRKGQYQLEDGTYRQEFFDMLSGYEKRMEYAAKNSSLPREPNLRRIEDFVMSVNRIAVMV
jgi:predicted nucleotidyltransferase